MSFFQLFLSCYIKQKNKIKRKINILDSAAHLSLYIYCILQTFHRFPSVAMCSIQHACISVTSQNTISTQLKHIPALDILLYWNFALVMIYPCCIHQDIFGNRLRMYVSQSVSANQPKIIRQMVTKEAQTMHSLSWEKQWNSTNSKHLVRASFLELMNIFILAYKSILRLTCCNSPFALISRPARWISQLPHSTN